jgi:hypothetical protein
LGLTRRREVAKKAGLFIRNLRDFAASREISKRPTGHRPSQAPERGQAVRSSPAAKGIPWFG